ncbi:MAG: LysE family transporter [Gammaproteobacteria bacterium]|jgi:threonine/homoserine/homoserine lactone efflux protein
MTDFQTASGLGAALAGALLGLSLAAPPGPIIAIMANASMQGRIRESLSMAFGAIAGDATWLGLAALGTIAFFRHHPRVIGVLGLAGAALLVWMAFNTWRAARSGFHEQHTPGSLRLGYVTAVTSPYNFAWWLANGALLFTAWGWPGIAGMFISLVIYSVLISYAFRWLGQRVESAVVGIAYLSVFMLAGFGLYFGYGAVRMLAPA